MKNRDQNEDALLTQNSEKDFLNFVTITDIPFLSKRIRDLVLERSKTHQFSVPLDWGEFLLHIDSLFTFFDALEKEYF